MKTTEQKHTPGPWRVEITNPRCGTIEVWNDERPVAVTAYYPEMGNRRGEQEANTRLIAAAPDILQALVELELRTRQFLAGELVVFPSALLPQVRAVIASSR